MGTKQVTLEKADSPNTRCGLVSPLRDSLFVEEFLNDRAGRNSLRMGGSLRMAIC